MAEREAAMVVVQLVSLAAKLDERLVIADPDARYFGVVLGDSTLVPDGTAVVAPTTFDDWLGRMIVLPLFGRDDLRQSR
jgi:hypothetical protein